jgi:hypothetical protein
VRPKVKPPPDTKTPLDRAQEMVAGFNLQQSPWKDIALLLNQMASAKKTALFSEDFSNREFAFGKVTGYLEAIQDLLDLPADCKALTEAAKK